MAKEWMTAQEKQTKPQQKNLPRPPSPPNCSVVRSDAAWRASTQLAGFGWIIKNQDAKVTSFSTGCSVRSALVAEAMAMRLAVQESKVLGHKRLVCESDSLQLTKALNGGEAPLEIYGIIADILDSSFNFDVFVFVWIPREKNSDADALAKQGLVVCEALMTST